MNAQLKPLLAVANTVKNAESKILSYLAERHGVVVSKQQLTAMLYADVRHSGPMSNTIEVFIGRIRRRRLNSFESIQTLRSQGYVYVHTYTTHTDNKETQPQ
jgi:DNA-binding response OmpR family regulator